VLATLTGSRTVELVVAPADGEAMVGSKAMVELQVCIQGRCDGDGLAGDFDGLAFRTLRTFRWHNELKKKLLQNGLEVSFPSERRLCKEQEHDRQIGEF
jgi:hypothetical protein